VRIGGTPERMRYGMCVARLLGADVFYLPQDGKRALMHGMR
jgi:hypothetical protein